MKTCALCVRSTSPKNGATNTSDAVLCHLCLVTYEASPYYRREQYFRKENHEGAMRAALNDFVLTTLKIRQVDSEKERHAKSLIEKEAREKEEAEKKTSTNGATAKQTPAPAQ